MTAGLKRLFSEDKAPASAANAPAEAVGASSSDALDLRFKPVVAPWHVRNARALIGGAILIGLAGAGFAGYNAWQLYFNPLDRALAPRGTPAAVPLPDAGSLALPPATDAPGPVRSPEAAKTTLPARAVSGTVAPSLAPPPPAGRGRVTHTLREDTAIEPKGAPPAAVPAGAARSESPGCGEGVAALGLCPAGIAKEAR